MRLDLNQPPDTNGEASHGHQDREEEDAHVGGSLRRGGIQAPSALHLAYGHSHEVSQAPWAFPVQPFHLHFQAAHEQIHRGEIFSVNKRNTAFIFVFYKGDDL